jgi:hypothetical protein
LTVSQIVSFSYDLIPWRCVMRALFLAVAATAVACVGLVPTASGGAPVTVTIAGAVTQFGPPPDFHGTWQSSGAISDAGSFVETELHLTGVDFQPSAPVGTFQAVIVFTGSHGTFTIAQQGVSTGLPTGTWHVSAGTGDYARASGHGTFAFSPPDNLTFTGVMSNA